ncbi:MAG TPA: lasso peptide biosynthesis B2 protein [Thermoanaerobaculia bacterium]
MAEATHGALRRCCEADCASRSGIFLSAFAYAVLVVVDLLMKFGGFRRLHRFVQKFPVRRRTREDEQTAHRICGAVDRAASLYVKRAWCLQRSVVAVCLLRLAGYPAELVIGARRTPFYAHAWAEIGDRVVNDETGVQTYYGVLERC